MSRLPRLFCSLAVSALLVACQGGRGQPSASATDADATPVPAQPEGLWLAGDTHVHTDHSSDGSALRQGLDQRGPGNVSVADQIGQGELNGLDWLPITDHRTFVQHYDPLWESSRLILITGEEANGSPHANPLGAVDTIVQGSVPEGRPSWSRLQTSIWDAHSQGAAWQHNHPDDGHLNDDLTRNENANAVGADLVEGWNSYSGIERSMEYAEAQWNDGFRFGITASSDSHFRELWALTGPGVPSTRAFAPNASARGVIQAMRAGRTTTTAGERRAPYVFLDADFNADGLFEAMAGDELQVPAGTPGVLRIRLARALPLLTRVHVYASPGGRVEGPIQTFTVTAPNQQFELELSAPDQPAWYYVEVRGVGAPHSIDLDAFGDPSRLHLDQLIVDERRAISSPIFIGPHLAEPEPAEALPPMLTRDDGAQRVLGQAGQFAGFPDVAVSNGVTHVVAERHMPGKTGVMYRRIDGNGAAEPIELAPLSASARFVRVAARGQDVWAVWQDERASQAPRRPAIYARHSANGGLSWAPEIVVRALDGRAEMPDVAVLDDGSPVIVWQEIAAGRAFDVMVQALARDVEPVNLSAAGKQTNPANLVDTRSARYPASIWPRLAVAPDGQLAVVFHDNRNDPDPNWTSQLGTGEDESTEFDNWDVMIALGQDGQWSALHNLGVPERADRHADVVFNDDGRLVVAWDSKEMRPAGVNTAIYSTWSDDKGASWQPPQSVAEDAQMMSQYPRLGAQGSLVRMAWYDNRASDWRWKIMTATLHAGVWGDGHLLPAPGNNTWPALSADQLVFASTRDAKRVQRDSTQVIYRIELPL